jgi:hypothetical protein
LPAPREADVVGGKWSSGAASAFVLRGPLIFTERLWRTGGGVWPTISPPLYEVRFFSLIDQSAFLSRDTMSGI